MQAEMPVAKDRHRRLALVLPLRRRLLRLVNCRWIDQDSSAPGGLRTQIGRRSIYVLGEDGPPFGLSGEGRGDRGGSAASCAGRTPGLSAVTDSAPGNHHAGAQMGGWMRSLGGLLNGGGLTAPASAAIRESEIETISDKQIRLKADTTGIIIPTILTLDRMAAEECRPRDGEPWLRRHPPLTISTENRCTVVAGSSRRAASTVEGNCGWFGLSGQCWHSRQNEVCGCWIG